jgi:hypothetical protein
MAWLIFAITERYAEDGSPSQFEWIANTRVTFTTDLEGIYVTQYYVDAAPISMNDIVTIQGFDEGVLERAGRTIQSAIDINKAAAIASSTPMSSGILKEHRRRPYHQQKSLDYLQLGSVAAKITLLPISLALLSSSHTVLS